MSEYTINGPQFAYAERPDLDKNVVREMLGSFRLIRPAAMSKVPGSCAYHLSLDYVSDLKAFLNNEDEVARAIVTAPKSQAKFAFMNARKTKASEGAGTLIYGFDLQEGRIELRTPADVKEFVDAQNQYTDTLTVDLEIATRRIVALEEDLRKKVATNKVYHYAAKTAKRELEAAKRRLDTAMSWLAIYEKAAGALRKKGIMPRIRIPVGIKPLNKTERKAA